MHFVRSHETLWSISRKYSVSLEALFSVNPKLSAKSLIPGMKVLIPSARVKRRSYVVKKHDTLYAIARKYKCPVSQIKRLNRIKFNTVIPGQVLLVPSVSLEQLRLSLPVRGEVFKSFGMYDHVYYSGIILKTRDVRLRSSYFGKVIFAGFLPGYGKTVMLRHSARLIGVYAAYNVRIIVGLGKTVKKRESIATFLKNGSRQDGYLCHFQLWYDGYPVNPMSYLDR